MHLKVWPYPYNRQKLLEYSGSLYSCLSKIDMTNHNRHMTNHNRHMLSVHKCMHAEMLEVHIGRINGDSMN